MTEHYMNQGQTTQPSTGYSSMQPITGYSSMQPLGSDFVLDLFSGPAPHGVGYQTGLPTSADQGTNQTNGGVKSFYLNGQQQPGNNSGQYFPGSGQQQNASPAPLPAPPANRTKRQAGVFGAIRQLQKIFSDAHHNAFTDDLQRGVKLLYKHEEREKYRVTIEHKMKRRGELFDTSWVVTKWESKQPGVNLIGRLRGTGQLPNSWRHPCIWVCAPNEEDKATFYSHICKIGRFHHSTFMGGGSVIGAGEWVVKQGKLISFSAVSGHYRTEMNQFYNAALHLRNAVRPDTTVLLWDTQAANWAEVPYKDFIQKPTGGGRYKTHPTAVS
jgi:hypothetical protein